ncbi:hypothetical protein PTSG_05035 [Salpingoeca rosetta]|uniref:Uncharacterized protein n=1 Tax=Salpingoeca rosetta (strain ATCC 50818 / BSB-021) TaxID=946362 RepID=F2U9B8_SALR5|nr:uncharacterized protein PTSG_05035 [Salpingoeca rosetta]EGD73321.1 hypothetical protein PTSG_05035 [Salpingoeca rosetta]|eukprot:XP_004994351.1 hypothetical protein PTSG_05035 [Salpingoeca rosetta]
MKFFSHDLAVLCGVVCLPIGCMIVGSLTAYFYAPGRRVRCCFGSLAAGLLVASLFFELVPLATKSLDTPHAVAVVVAWPWPADRIAQAHERAQDERRRQQRERRERQLQNLLEKQQQPRPAEPSKTSSASHAAPNGKPHTTATTSAAMGERDAAHAKAHDYDAQLNNTNNLTHPQHQPPAESPSVNAPGGMPYSRFPFADMGQHTPSMLMVAPPSLSTSSPSASSPSPSTPGTPLTPPHARADNDNTPPSSAPLLASSSPPRPPPASSQGTQPTSHPTSQPASQPQLPSHTTDHSRAWSTASPSGQRRHHHPRCVRGGRRRRRRVGSDNADDAEQQPLLTDASSVYSAATINNPPIEYLAGEHSLAESIDAGVWDGRRPLRLRRTTSAPPAPLPVSRRRRLPHPGAGDFPLGAAVLIALDGMSDGLVIGVTSSLTLTQGLVVSGSLAMEMCITGAALSSILYKHGVQRRVAVPCLVAIPFTMLLGAWLGRAVILAISRSSAIFSGIVAFTVGQITYLATTQLYSDSYQEAKAGSSALARACAAFFFGGLIAGFCMNTFLPE